MPTNEQFETFRVSSEKEQIDYLAKILDDNDIEYDIDYGAPTEGGIMGSAATIDYYLKIARTDFEKAETLIKQAEGELDMNSIDENHPFFAFSKEELIEVVQQPYDWDSIDYQLAIALLRKQNVEISDEELKRYKDEQIAKLSEMRSNSGIVVSGYALSLLGFALNILALMLIFSKIEITPLYTIGAFMCMICAIALGKSCKVTKILPNGQKVPTYTESTRRHGSRIIMLSFVLLLVTLVQFGIWLLK
ncbi:MAG: hypothetical protein J6Y82_00225 [Bacteroidales bacterium]|nr:hypothetical protein [Bacteroidales bacterium]